MCDTYVPREGDRVRFYSWAAQMDLFGEVLSVAPQARLATIREDNEDGHTCVKSWDTLHLVEASRPALLKGLVDRLRAERDEAIKRADRAEAGRRAWESTAKTNMGLARISKLNSTRQGERADEAEAKLSDTLDDFAATAFDLQDAEARASSWWEAAKHFARDYYAATETAQSIYQRAEIAEAELNTLREGLRALGADPTQIQNLRAQLNLRDKQWREERFRADGAERELSELKKALATLAGAEVVPTVLP